MPTTPPKSNFDLDLDFGQMWERIVCRMFEGEGSIEVKADKMWAKTKNLCFEYARECSQSPDGYQRTGLMSTEAKWWVNVLVNPSNDKLSSGVRMWEVSRLKYILKNLLSQGRAWTHTMGGDGGRTCLILTPLDALTETNLFDYTLDLKKDYATIKRRKGFDEEWDSCKENIKVWEMLKFDID